MRHTHALLLAAGLGSPIAFCANEILDFPGPDYRILRDQFSPPRGCFSSPLIKVTPPVQFLETLSNLAGDRGFKSAVPTPALPLDNPFAEPIRIFDRPKAAPPKIELKDSPAPAPKH